MARKSVSGQLNMFDLFDVPMGEVEMVSLMPSFEEEPEIVEEVKVEAEPELEAEPEIEAEPESEAEPEVEAEPEAEVDRKMFRDAGDRVAMSRTYEKNGEKIEIAYINYNAVRIIKGDSEPVIKQFHSTKEAVDFYVEQMQTLEE